MKMLQTKLLDDEERNDKQPQAHVDKDKECEECEETDKNSSCKFCSCKFCPCFIGSLFVGVLTISLLWLAIQYIV